MDEAEILQFYLVLIPNHLRKILVQSLRRGHTWGPFGAQTPDRRHSTISLEIFMILIFLIQFHPNLRPEWIPHQELSHNDLTTHSKFKQMVPH